MGILMYKNGTVCTGKGAVTARCAGFGCTGVELFPADAQQWAWPVSVTPVMHSNGDVAQVIEE